MPVRRHRVDQIPTDEPRLLEGARLWNAGAFFEAHEVWESLWHEVAGRERDLLQGLIQLAAAYHHLSRGNEAGARYLYRRGRPRVAAWTPRHAGIAINELLAAVDADFVTGCRGRRRERRPKLLIG